MSDSSPTVEELEARLQRQREELARSVDELAAQADPRVHMKNMSRKATDKVRHASPMASQAWEKASQTAQAAREGDTQSRVYVAAAAAGALAVVGLMGRLLSSSSR